MNFAIREATQDDFEPLAQLTVLAFEPVFDSFAEILGPEIFAVVYPDWRAEQRGHVETAYKNEAVTVLMADVDGTAAGLITYAFNHETKIGEVQFLAVHPEYQNAGIGTQLNEFVTQKMVAAGMRVLTVGTGGDGSHAPARRAYEKAGFTAALPSVYYFKKLPEVARK